MGNSEMTVEYPMRVLRRATLLALFFAPSSACAESVVQWVQSATEGHDFAALRGARAALDAQDPATAIAALKDYQGPISDLAALWRAEAYAASGASELALQALMQPLEPRLCSGPDVRHQANVELKAGLLAEGAPLEAAELLSGLPPTGARLVQAEAWFRKAGRADRAEEMVRRLLSEVPGSFKARARARTLGADRVARVLKTAELRTLRVRKLLAVHLNSVAASEAKVLAADLGPKHELACELGYIEGKARRKMRRYRPAQRTLEAARKLCTRAGKKKFALRIALLETRVRSIRGQVRGTRLLADWIQRQSPGHRYADDALLMHAQVLQRKGKEAAALAAYRRLVETFPNGDYVPTARWRLAFVDIQAGRMSKAAAHLDSILAMKARPMEHARARYWRAKLLLQSGKTADARDLFERLVLDPSFYGWMALDRLQKTHPEWVKSWKKELSRLSGAPNQALAVSALGIATAPARRAAIFSALDMPDWAASELDGVACKLSGTGPRRALATVFDALGMYHEAQMHMRATQPGWRDGVVDSAHVPDWRLAYSRPFTTEISNASKAAKIEALFLTALSREESTFDPDIVSWAGATGLAQLMPATAVGAYADVFGGRLKMGRLTEPALNLRLGAHVLGQGLRGFKRIEPLALAAYNGGPGLARRFVPAAAVPFDIWVERMTVKETRRYVKRVVETWGVYRWLYDSQRPFISLAKSIGGSG